MGLGAVIWFAGEMVAVYKGSRGGTTTWYVRRYTKGRIIRQAGLVAFAVWFVGHMLAGWPP
jgi:hypothetical protein